MRDYIDHFGQWLRNGEGRQQVGLRPDEKFLFTMDGHTSHYNDEIISTAEKWNIVICILPPSLTGHLQPLDVYLFGIFKNKLSAAKSEWLHANKSWGRSALTQHTLRLLPEWATDSNIAKSFQKAGLWPLDRSVHEEALLKIESSTTRSETCMSSIQSQLPCHAYAMR
jgi:hypothetical protein